MNASLKLIVYPLVTLISIAASGLVLAESPTAEPTNFVATKTREQVRSEFLQSRATGGFRVWSTSYNPLLVTKTMTTREAVKAEMALLANVAPMTGEDSGSFALSRAPASREAPRLLASTQRR